MTTVYTEHFNECPECGSSVKDITTIIRRNYGGKIMYYKNTPAIVCENDKCGKLYLAGSVAKRMEVHNRRLEKEMSGVFDYSRLGE